MVTGKRPTKEAASKAAKTLRNSKASKKAKSAAGKTLSKRAKSGRRVKSAPKQGKVSRSSVKRAVKSVRKM